MQQEAEIPSRVTPSRVTGTDREIRPGRVMNLAFEPSGAEHETTVFFCHGAGGNKNHWRHQYAALGASGRRVVAWDFPGHGTSPQPRRWSAYAGHALVEDYCAIFNRYGTGRNFLVAHSYGTLLTLALLQRLSEEGALDRVTGAVLLGPPGPDADLRRGPLAVWPVFLLALMRPYLNKGFRDLAWHPDTDRALVRAEEAETAGNSLFMMKALVTQSVAPDRAALAGLDLPILILAGDRDRLTPAAGAEALAGLLPQARYEVIRNSGHQIMLEQPEAVTGFLMDAIGKG